MKTGTESECKNILISLREDRPIGSICVSYISIDRSQGPLSPSTDIDQYITHLKYVPKLQTHFVKYCDNFPNICPIYVLSSDMTSEAYEDNFQLCSVSKLKNLGVENNARKFGVF